MVKAARSTSAFAALTLTNILLLALIVGFAGLFLYIGTFAKPSVSKHDLERYRAVAQARFEQNSREIESEFQSLSREMLPPISEAIRNRAQRDYGRYVRTLEREGTVYLTNVERLLVKKVQARYRDFLDRHRDILMSEFPKHANSENVELVLQDFANTFSSLVERYYLDEFHRESERTQRLWVRFEPAQAPSDSEPSLEEQLINTTADWAVIVASAPPPASQSINAR